jgi:RecJ-like exonuclease
VECPACKGAGIVAPEKVRGVSQVRAAASKVQSLIFKEPATFRDDDWIKTNRCKRCRATGYITCPACDGAGKRGPKS